MTKSKIEWTDETWNPVTGCTKVSDGCKHCYAERLFPRVYGKQIVYRQYDEIRGGVPPGLPVKRQFTDVWLHPERLDKPLHWRKPRRVFVNSMSDLFHEAVPLGFIDNVFRVMALCPQHTFQILTKRPRRMFEYLTSQPAQRVFTTETEYVVYSFPLPNVWLGISAEDQKTADERTRILLQTPAAVRFISLEPLLAEIDLRAIDLGDLYWLNALTGNVRIAHDGGMPEPAKYAALDWVIAGGESGPGARPSKADWFRYIRNQCWAAGVPFFFKQWGEWIPHDQWLEKRLDAEPMKRHGHYHRWGDGSESWKAGKKVAGRLLDGNLWDEYPK